jgi:predicted PurR-regulated permease PerM
MTEMDSASSPPDRPQRISFVTLAVVTAALYLGREVLIPLALAVLFSFILAWPVQRLERLRLGRVPAVLLVVVLVFGGLTAVGWTVGSQLMDLAQTLPKYERNIRAKAMALHDPGYDVLQQTKRMVQKLRGDLSAAPSPAPAPGAEAPPRPPVPVTVVEAPLTPVTILRTFLGPLLGPLATAGLVIVFVVFMLVQLEDLRDRMLRLLGRGRPDATAKAFDEATFRVSRYLLMQSLVNLGLGVAVGLGLFLIGVPNAVLWGLLAAVLRFVPYIGIWIASSMPILLSFAVFPDWWRPAVVAGFFAVLELAAANFVEPLLYGSETGISAIGILVAAVFWTWLWGPVGLLLSTPLTVCLVVLGRHFPQFRFLYVLLGDEPALESRSAAATAGERGGGRARRAARRGAAAARQ